VCQNCIPQTSLHDTCMCRVFATCFTHTTPATLIYTPASISWKGRVSRQRQQNVQIQGEFKKKEQKKSQIGQIHCLAFVHIFPAFWEVNGLVLCQKKDKKGGKNRFLRNRFSPFFDIEPIHLLPKTREKI